VIAHYGDHQLELQVIFLRFKPCDKLPYTTMYSFNKKGASPANLLFPSGRATAKARDPGSPGGRYD
jgi:hypothetical protein